MLFGIYSAILFGILPGIYSEILAGFLAGIYFDMLFDKVSAMFGHLFWHLFDHSIWHGMSLRAPELDLVFRSVCPNQAGVLCSVRVPVCYQS